ncbi:mitochondrial rRNA methyltransferase [Spathaspora passalidarum NRRL Y-27907]|uniref:rRNA methyltransferase 2, mitochondrial n=1 Tax=Spathaspora passalidarum (strain NRRL Y-27907 / 11-Y1) TaxID=619300 RepID=G3AIK5_SPAPN|nr:mitochondrial rRNA methyltransferase [Spathaspora passalidarum NRRL Y-27907]EGW33721.1 mitochondrial rRNA methyltransferase [Spathaspora passalidarum NRRL Y-27907]
MVSHCIYNNAIRPFLQVRYKSGKSSTLWLARKSKDIYTQQSKTDFYRSRAAYKLIEIDQKYRLFKKAINIVDLGSAPGAWTQVAVERTKNVKADILGVDLLRYAPPVGTTLIQGDMLKQSTHDKIRDHFAGVSEEIATHESAESKKVSSVPSHPVDLIISDMMANTSGMKDADHFASMDLCSGAIILAHNLLRPGGSLVMKYFSGKQDKLLKESMEIMFKRVHLMVPKASRDESRELYIIGLNKHPNLTLDEIFPHGTI